MNVHFVIIVAITTLTSCGCYTSGFLLLALSRFRSSHHTRTVSHHNTVKVKVHPSQYHHHHPILNIMMASVDSHIDINNRHNNTSLFPPSCCDKSTLTCIDNSTSNDTKKILMNRRQLLVITSISMAFISTIGTNFILGGDTVGTAKAQGIIPPAAVPVSPFAADKLKNKVGDAQATVDSNGNEKEEEKERFEPINMTQIFVENKVNVTVTNAQTKSQIYINQTSYDIITKPIPPYPTTTGTTRTSWLPAPVIPILTKKLFLKQQEQVVVETISDYKVFMAAVAAGSFTEIIRSIVLYPITTIKTRVQYKPPSMSTFEKIYQQFLDYVKTTSDTATTTKSSSSTTTTNTTTTTTTTTDIYNNTQNQTITSIVNNDYSPHTKLTKLYAGIMPFLIASVPSAGIYFGIRDVSKREMVKLFQSTSTPTVATSSTSTSTIASTIQSFFPSLVLDDLSITLISVLLGDIFCLAIKTPALLFSLRKQVATIEDIYDDVITNSSTTYTTDDDYEYDYNGDDDTNTNSSHFKSGTTSSNDINTTNIVIIKEPNHFIIKNSDQNEITSTSSATTSTNAINYDDKSLQPRPFYYWWGDILKDSYEQLPIIILTDLPYLLIKISLLRIFTSGHENVAEYTLLNTVISCLCASITTPFDVVRTRILVDSNGDSSDGLDGGWIVKDASKYLQRGGSIQNIIFTINLVMNESEHGVRNLFAGWYERVLYLGLSIAWFDSIRTLSYMGIRDFLLLKHF